MKYLGHKNCRNEKLKLTFRILGYDVFVPYSYFSPISYLKKGCPIWNLNKKCSHF